MNESPVAGQYDKTIDRESAFEMLQKKAEQAARPTEDDARQTSDGNSEGGRWSLPDFGNGSSSRSGQTRTTREPASRAPRGSSRQTVTEAAIKSVVRSVGSQLGRALVRGILGSLSKR